jgi:hypothetical protein
MIFTEEDEASADPATVAPAVTRAAAHSSRRRLSEAKSASSVFHPLAYRGVVAQWPVEWREQWGRRANEFEDSGLSWRDAETQAFVEVWKLRQQDQHEQPSANLAATSSALRN